jgi:hypothetical protein
MLGNVADLGDDLSLLREPLEEIAERSAQKPKRMLTKALSPQYASGNTPLLAASGVSPRFGMPTAEEAEKQKTEKGEKRRARPSALEHSPLAHVATFNDRDTLQRITPTTPRGARPPGFTASGEKLPLFPAKTHATLNNSRSQNVKRFVNGQVPSLAGNGQRERERAPEKERDFDNENKKHWCRLMDV